MPQELIGSFGRFAMTGEGRVLDINLDAARTFFNDLAIRKSNMVLNSMGLYRFLPVGRMGKAKAVGLSTPKNLLQPRPDSCLTWNPKGNIRLTSTEINTHPVVYQGEQCSDVYYDDCLEYVLPVGRDAVDFTGTPEGLALWDLMIENLFTGLGNSLYDLVHFANHPLIALSRDNSWWNTGGMTQEDFDDFIDQNYNADYIDGHLTLIDDLKDDGNDHFNVVIDTSEVDGEDFIGNAQDLIRRCKNAATTKFRTVLKRRRAEYGVTALVTHSIYEKLRQEIIAQHGDVPEVYRYKILRDGILEPVDGVLMFDGMMIASWDELDEFTEALGVAHHRVVLTMNNNLMIAHDVDSLPQFDGLGVQITQRLRAPFLGRTFLDTGFRVGAAIAEHEFMVNASITLAPGGSEL